MADLLDPFVLLPSTILLAGLADDLCSRKIHNWLVLLLIVVAGVGQFYLAGWDGIKFGILALLVAAAINIPLVLVGAMGAGDMKLMLAFGLATNISAVIYVTIYSFIWGGLLGLTRAFLQKEGLVVLKNTVGILKGDKPDPAKIHKMPYSVALFFGWLTYLTLKDIPGGLLW